MKKLVRGLLLGTAATAAVAGGAIYGYHWWTVGRFTESTDNAYVRADITSIAPKVSGHVVAVPVQDNQPVEAGDVLVRIDDTDYRAQRDHARADVEGKRAALGILQSQRALQRAVIEQADAAVAAAEAEQQRSDRESVRQRSLVGSGWTTHQRFEQASADQQRAAAALLQAQAAAAAARRQLDVYDAQEVGLRADLERAEADLRLAEKALEDTVIRAPVAGIVGNRSAELGQFARQGSQLLVLVPLQGAWVEANFKETQLTDMQPGQRVSIRVDAYPGLALTGRVASLAPASGAEFSLLPPENATGNFTKIVQRIPVRIALDPDPAADGRLRPGLSVEVSVHTRDGVAGALAAEPGR